MRSRRALTLLLCGTALGLAACGEPTVSIQAEPAASETDRAAIVDELGTKYAQLMATATARRVTAADLQAAGIAEDTPGIPALLDYFTCGYGEAQGWNKRGKTTGKSRVVSTTWNTPDEIGAQVVLTVRNSADTATPGAEHALRIQRRDGKWTIIGDNINYPAMGSTSDESETAGEAEPTSGSDRSDTPLGACAPPSMSS